MKKLIELAIIIPTRNRPHFIPIGLSSILRQLGDLAVTVILSDNSDKSCADINNDYVRSLESDRCTYARPPEVLSMVDHWNWAVRFSLENTTCSHFTILTDRGFYRKDALRDLLDKVGAYKDDVVSFMGDTILDYSDPIVIGENSWSGSLRTLSTRLLLAEAAKCNFSPALPKFLNSVIPRAVLMRRNRKTGHIFPPTISPDYGFAFESLVELEQVVFYEKSLTVGLGLKKSNGAAFATGRFNEVKAREFIDLYEKSGRQFKFKCPLPEIMIPANAIVHEYVSLIERHEDIVLSEVNRGTYLKHMFHSVKGVEDRELRNQYTKILQRAGYQETTWEMLKGAVRRLKEWINKGNNRTFESIDEAIEYSYHNYPQPVADRRHAH